MQCASYCKLGAKYSAHPPVCAMWTVVPAIYNEMTTPHIESSIFNCTYLRSYWRYLDNSMSVILQSWCQILRLFSGLRYVNCGPEIYNAITVPHIQASIFKWKYLLWYWRYIDSSMRVILQTWSKIQRTFSSLYYVDCGHVYIQCSYSSAYSGLNI
jgi:hypothetical protein